MNYKETLNLPRTSFPMKADLPKREPLIQAKWRELDIYASLRKKHAEKPKYILHDGPPYANGDIHIGHALNKILKDIVVKFKSMRGFDCPFVPGWDCHGLPVEHQLFKELGISKSEIGQLEFRKKAQRYALKYVGIQKDQFKRLGVFGDWENPYLTLSPEYVASVLRTFGKLVKQGYVYKGLKPVNWCAECETALAEAEVEYADLASPSIYVKFQLLSELIKDKRPIYFMIWTTTPWTLVSNVAIAVHPDFEYALVSVKNEVLIIAKDLVSSTMKKVGVEEYELLHKFPGRDLEGLSCQHPFIDRKSQVILADFVSKEEGTGCVHIAPGHGEEDYVVGRKYDLPMIMPVDNRGRFDASAGDFQGLKVFDADKPIVEKLDSLKALLHSDLETHSYPHCWRCKNPIVFRATEQWFLSVDKNELRQKILETIKRLKWIPALGEKRISSMIEGRPDWCLSRQRYWGVPIPAFYCKKCNAVLLDADIIEVVSAVVEKEGSDAWFTREAAELLPEGVRCPSCGSDTFIKEEDILDVWFDSGVSAHAVLKRWEGLAFPAELYLEGSDQHRGWFQTSLLASVGAAGVSPFKAVLTHGFVVDGEGKKMSKSLGNVISPQEVIEKYGADILRLWVASCDYSEDVRISSEIIARCAEGYRKIRNTFKFLLGNLYDFDPASDGLPHEELCEIDRWALLKLNQLVDSVTKNYERFEFYRAYHAIYKFCIMEMSSFYLDILKDRLYTFMADSRERRSSQTVLYQILNMLVRITAPILPFTCEEAWAAMGGRKEVPSVHLCPWPEAKVGVNEGLGQSWEGLISVREAVLKALEEKREAKEIGNSLEAKVELKIADDRLHSLLSNYKHKLATIFIVSEVSIKKETSKAAQPLVAKVGKAPGEKCQRCWMFSETVGKDAQHPQLCQRCVRVVKMRPGLSER